ncbi:MAG: nucleotidyltransferase family protein [Aminipila sp.]
MRDKINIIFLAAGNSRRFGSNKLLTEFRGKRLYRHTFDLGKSVSEWLTKNEVDYNIVIVSQYDEILEEAGTLGYMTVKNSRPELGISYSIKLALSACAEPRDKENKKITIYNNYKYMFFVCDQPLLQSQSVINLIFTYMSSDKIMGCISYKERLGNPCIFNSKCIPDLLKLEGEVGGKKIILLNQNDTLMVDCCDEKELFDIDTIMDFNELVNDRK